MDAQELYRTSTARSAQPLKVVAIGGGTGLGTVLKGLKAYVRTPEHPTLPAGGFEVGELTAVVTVTDDGGSSGRLRREFNMLPPGDIRNCMVALSEDEALLARLFQYRFPAGTGLEGHSFGNLFLTALANVTGDFAEAVKLSTAILASRGHIVPSTTSNVQLDAFMDNGSRVRGETSITASPHRILELRLVPANARPLPQTLRAIEEADVITVGPGSLFTSLIPNLLVRGIPEAIVASPALKVFICNLMTQAGETRGFTASRHARTLAEAAGEGLLDTVLVNSRIPPESLVEKYRLEGAEVVRFDPDGFEGMGVTIVRADLMSATSLVRHDPASLAREILSLARE